MKYIGHRTTKADERIKLVGSLMLRLRMERGRIKGSGDDSFRNGQLRGLETAEDIVREVFNIPEGGAVE